MQHQTTQPSRMRAATLLRALAALAAAGTTCGAAAAEPNAHSANEPNPYYIGARQEFTHNSNVYAIPNGPGDSYSTTSLLGGFDQPIGRERLYANGSVGVNRFRDQTVLNNVSYSLAGGLDWSTIHRFSGNFYASAARSLASLGDNGTLVPVGTRNLVNTNEIGARVRWGEASLLSVEGGLAHNRVSYSADAAASGDASQDSGDIGLFYRPGALLRIGTAVRLTHGDQPNAFTLPGGVAQPNTSNSRSIDFLADWTPSARTGVSGRLSWTRQSNSTSEGLDFSGLTGALNASYQATGKIALNASLSRDSGINSAFFSQTIIPANDQFPTAIRISGLSQNSQVTSTLGLGASYAATAKINANASYQYQHAVLSNNASSGGLSARSDGTDNLSRVALGVNYAPARNWLLGCNLGHDARDVSGFVAFSYSVNTVGCSAQYALGR